MCTPDSDVLCVCNMQFLYLSYNQIGDTGMRAFATALAGGAMAAGATIFLNNTNLTEAGKQALLDAAMALQCSHGLTVLC